MKFGAIYIQGGVRQGAIYIQRGVRQGDTLSPKIFTTTIEEVFKKAQLNGGVVIDGEMLTDLRFADDVALISTSIADMESQLSSLNKESKSIGLTMHKDKTKYMTNFDTQEEIEIEGRKTRKSEGIQIPRANTENGRHHEGGSSVKN